MNFHFAFSRRRVSLAEVADLRDRLIVAETRAILLEDIVQNTPRKPVRAVRKDAGAYLARKAAVEAELRGKT